MNKRCSPACRVILCLGLLLGGYSSRMQAGNFDNEWFRIFGYWDGRELRADSIQLRLAEESPDKGQISGQVDSMDFVGKKLAIGPFQITWNERTKFVKIKPDQFDVNKTLKVSGRLISGNHFEASSFTLESSPFAPHSLQITGLSGFSKERSGGMHEFFVLNVPVYTPQNGFNTFKSLVRRQDVRRPDDQLKFNLLGKPVTIGGEYDLNPGIRENFDLDDSEPDQSVRMDQELKLEAFYPVSNFTAIFLSFKGFTDSRFNLDGTSPDRTNIGIARDETWIFFDRLFGTGLGLQFGNQNISETREWWWDKDMDALRLYYNRGPLHFELAGGKQIGGESTVTSINPEDDEVYRILGLGSWLWSGKQRLELYFLKQWDRSSQEQTGQIIKRINRDRYDDDAVWFGGRAIGEIGLGDYGDVNYWLDVAGVHGKETVFGFDNIGGTNLTAIDSVRRSKVDGWAFDAGAFWTLPFMFHPTFTLSYAHASGDSDPNGHNGSFRQTGINRNKWRFNGVNRFRVYGELLRPELSNLNIFTSAFGIRLLRNSSIELVYHKYDQDEATNRLRNSSINQNPNGLSRDIGQEGNIVMNFREWKRLELGLTGALFDPGSAFNEKELAYSLFLDINLNF